ncbi:MAG: ribonuclease P protein component [Verrucomicrobia bacterium A1]|nr:MAG: ribonuclease P protein component [Verrucomicrobia bacterium A1]
MIGDPGAVESRGSAARPDIGLPRARRLTRTSGFQEAYGQGRKFVGRYMVLFLRNGPDAALRLGVVTSRKVGGAVARNRARRRIREVFRHARPDLTGAEDVVLVARAARREPSLDELRADFLALADRAGLRSATP